MICCSDQTYLIGSPPLQVGPVPDFAASHKVKEIMSWRNVPTSEVTDLLQCLYPAVVRIGESGKQDHILVVPVWLGYESGEHLPTAANLPIVYPPTLQEGSRQEVDRPEPRHLRPSPWSLERLGALVGITPGFAIPKSRKRTTRSRLRTQPSSPGPSFRAGPPGGDTYDERYVYDYQGYETAHTRYLEPLSSSHGLTSESACPAAVQQYSQHFAGRKLSTTQPGPSPSR